MEKKSARKKSPRPGVTPIPQGCRGFIQIFEASIEVNGQLTVIQDLRVELDGKGPPRVVSGGIATRPGPPDPRQSRRLPAGG